MEPIKKDGHPLSCFFVKLSQFFFVKSFNSLLSTGILFLAITTGKLRLLQRTETSRSSTVSITENHVLMGCRIHKQRSYNFLSCAHLCLARSGCASVNYENVRNGMCELNRLPSPTSVTNKARPGYLFGQLVVSIFFPLFFCFQSFGLEALLACTVA